MTFKRIFVAMLVILLAGAFDYVYAQGKNSAKAEAQAMVIKAEEFIKANGPDAAIAEINKSDGQFVKDYFHVFAYDLKGTVIAHPFRLSLRGKNVLKETDSKGKFFRKEIIEKAKTKGEGWVDYTYFSPKTRKDKFKTTYFKKVGDMIICCDAY